MLTEIFARRDRILSIAVLALLSGFLILLPRYLETAKVWFYLLSLLAIVLMLADPRQLIRTTRPEQVLFAAILANFAWILFTYHWNGAPGQGDAFIWNRQFHFLMLIPLFFLFRRFPVSDRQMLLILIAGAALTSAALLIDMTQATKFKIQGMSGNKFGAAQVCIAGIFALSWICLKGRWERTLAVLGLALSLFVIVATKSKAAWIMIPVLTGLFLFYLPSALSLGRKLAIFCLMLALICASYFVPMVKQQIDRASTNLSQNLASEHYTDKVRRGTFGARMEMWKAAWKMFLEKPITGVGLGGFREVVHAKSDQYEVNKIVKKYWHPHNQYLNALATRGIPGLALMLLLLVVPATIALARDSRAPDDPQARNCILLLCSAFAVMNCFEDYFESKSIIIFYVTLLALYLSRISPLDTSRQEPDRETASLPV